MGAALEAIGDTTTLLRHNRVILTGGAALTIGAAVVWAGLSLVPLVGPLLWALVLPAVMTGLLGLVYAGRNGDADYDDVVSGVSENYLSYLGANAIIAVVTLIFGIFAAIVILIVGRGARAGVTDGTLGEPEPGIIAGLDVMLLVLGLFALLLAVVVGFLVQFFDVAIVVDDAGSASCFLRSVALVRSAPGSVVGYTLIRAAIVSVVVVPYVLLGGGPDGTGAPVLAIWVLVLVPLGTVVSLTYHVAFYNRHKSKGTL